MHAFDRRGLPRTLEKITKVKPENGTVLVFKVLLVNGLKKYAAKKYRIFSL